jgi:Cyclin-dependent kinase inhibitor 3 (CDKN3)
MQGAALMTDPLRPFPESYWVLPGRFLAGEYPIRSFTDDQARLRLDTLLEAQIDTFVDLTQLGELQPYLSLLQEQARVYERKVNYLRYPILDLGLPACAEMVATLNGLDDALSNGHQVYLHCWGGIGRTGTTVGCYLVRHGKTGQQALDQIAEWWQDVPKRQFYPRSPQTDAQVQFILDWKE